MKYIGISHRGTLLGVHSTSNYPLRHDQVDVHLKDASRPAVGLRPAEDMANVWEPN